MLIPEFNLFKHQEKAIYKFVENKGRLRLLHEAGTGKTYTFIGAYLFTCYMSDKNLKAVVICPKVLKTGQWEPFLKEHGLTDRVSVYSYAYIYRHIELLRGDFLILDEDHKLSNPSSKMLWAIRKQITGQFKFRIGGTGTPTKSSYTDHYAPLTIYYHDVYLFSFSNWALKFGKFNNTTMKYYQDSYYKKKFHEYLVDKCDVVRLSEVVELPDIVYKHIHLKMNRTQHEYYQHFGMEEEELMLLNTGTIMLKQRQVTSDILIHDGEVIKEWDNKITALLDIMDNIPEQEPVLIWGNFTHENKKIYSKISKIRPSRLWIGGTKKNIEEWNSGEVNTLVCHPSSVGMGLNLQRCHIMIFHSIDWGIVNFLQAIARVQRLGQKHKVVIYILSYDDTIENYIWKKLKTKNANHEEILNNVKKLSREAFAKGYNKKT